MLQKYFFTRFFLIFTLALAGLIPLFASCDVVIRLASVPFSFQILKLFLFMLPLVCLFAIPIASSLAVGMTMGTLFSRGELLLFHFFPLARKKLEGVVLLFAVLLCFVYAPLLLKWAPASYWEGKQFLIRAAQQQIENLPARQFHQIASRGMIFFEEKGTSEEGDSSFRNILLMCKEKNKKQYLVTAQSGVLREGVLTLFEGSIFNTGNDGAAEALARADCIATFKSLEIAFEEMFFKQGDGVEQKPTKFLLWDELLSRSQEEGAWKELHKRLLQLLWQLLLPLLVFMGMMVFGKPKSNLLLSVVVSGMLFLISYLTLNMAYFFLKPIWWIMVIFYGMPVAAAVVLGVLYKRRWP